MTETQTYRAEDHYAELFTHLRIMQAALKEIAQDDYHGLQAHKSTLIAAKALEDCGA